MCPESDLHAPDETPETSGGTDPCSETVDVVGIGSCMMNYVALVPELGHSQRKRHSQGLEVAPGGATVLSLIQLARLGISTAWLGILGDDDDSSRILKHLEEEKIMTRGIERRRNSRSPFSWVTVTPNGDRSTFVFPNVLSDLTAENVSAAMVGCIDSCLHFHTDISTIPLRTNLQAIEVAYAADCMVFTDVDSDPVYLVEEVGLGRPKELEAILQKTDVLKMCQSAALRITGEKTPAAACQRLHETYQPRYTVVTAGRSGSYMIYDGEVWHIPALGGPAVDSTGAGGAYYGGLSYALLTGIRGESAGYFAAACAAFACSRVGSLHLGTREDINAILSGEEVEEAAESDLSDIL